eukprot:UN06927
MEAFMISAAASFISGVGHGAAYKVAGQLALSLEAVIAADIKHPDVQKILVALDVNASLSTIKALLEDLKRILPRCGSTMKVCFDNLHNSVASIQEQLEIVETKCKTHNVSYWSYIYTYPDVTNELNKIKQLKTIMDRRIDLVTQSTTIELQIASFNKTRKIKHTQPMLHKQIQRQIQTNDTFDDEGNDENEYVFVEKDKNRIKS